MASKYAITNQNIKTSPTNKKQNKVLLFNDDELTKIINLDNKIDNNRVVTNHKLDTYRKDQVDINIKKQRETEIKEELQRENKIITSKGELSELINNELQSECNVILTKSISVEYLNDKIESEQMKIIKTTVIKSETNEEIYESEIESEDETGQTSQVLTIDEMVGNIIKNLHKIE